jgi:hypothetical protein
MGENMNMKITTPAPQKQAEKDKTDIEKNTFAYDQGLVQGIEQRQPQNPYNAPRIDKAGSSARIRKGRTLQLSDMDWYAR